MLSCMSCIYIHWVLTPYLSHHLQIFSPFSRLSFILFMVSFAVQKLLSLIRSHLFIFAFIPFSLGDGSTKTLLHLCQSILLLFPSRSYMVSNLTCRSSIHFEFIFVYGVGECSNFILLHVVIQFSQYQLLNVLGS